MFHRKRREAGHDEEADPSVSSSSTAAAAAASPSVAVAEKRGMKRMPLLPTSKHQSVLVVLGILLLLTALRAAARRWLSTLAFLRVVTLCPVAVCLYRGIGPRRQQGPFATNSNLSPSLERILPLVLVVTVVAAQFPAFLGSAVAAAAVVGFSLVTLPQTTATPPAALTISNIVTTNSPSNQNATGSDAAATAAAAATHSHTGQQTKGSPVKILLAVLLLVTVLLTENFMVWVVSATFEPGWKAASAPDALQDNGRAVIQFLAKTLKKSQVVGLRRLWNVQWSLVACFAVALFLVEAYHPRRRLYSICVRAVLTLAAARFIRTVSFLLTVLPSQHVTCYAQHFPYPPPDNWLDWIAVGFQPASHGGCNDLIISGHATVTSTLACLATSVSGDYVFGACLWIMVALDYAVEIYEGFHYSVDMWLGMVLVTLLWNAFRSLEERDYNDDDNSSNNNNNSTSGGTVATAVQNGTSSRKTTVGFTGHVKEVGLLSLPAMMAYIQLSMLPPSTANPLIVVYVVFAAGIFYMSVRTAGPSAALYQHYAQHVLFCLLYLALGVYL